MNIRHLFGRTITFRYIPAVDGEEHTAYSLTSARIYRNLPSAEQAANTASGHIEEVTSWTLVNEEGTGASEYKITFSPIADPSPGSSSHFDLYYVALNYKAQSGSTSLQDWEQLPIYREDGFTGKIRVSAQDVYDLDTGIEAMAESILWTEAKIDAAIEDIVATVKGWGYRKRQVFNWEELNAAARRLATAYCCFGLISDGGQAWIGKGQMWKEKAEHMLNAAKIGYDAAGTDAPDPESAITTGAVAFLR